MYFIIVDETCSCRLVIMLGDGPRCKELGDESFSAYRSDAGKNYFRHHFLIIIKRKEKKNLPACGKPEATHVTQTGSSRIFKGMVPVG